MKYTFVPRILAFSSSGKCYMAGAIPPVLRDDEKIVYLPTEDPDYIGPVKYIGKTEQEILSEVAKYGEPEKAVLIETVMAELLLAIKEHKFSNQNPYGVQAFKDALAILNGGDAYSEDWRKFLAQTPDSKKGISSEERHWALLQLEEFLYERRQLWAEARQAELNKALFIRPHQNYKFDARSKEYPWALEKGKLYAATVATNLPDYKEKGKVFVGEVFLDKDCYTLEG